MIAAKSIVGSGVISAIGGNGGIGSGTGGTKGVAGGGGGGGLIAVLTSQLGLFNFDVSGGLGLADSAQNGQPGNLIIFVCQ